MIFERAKLDGVYKISLEKRGDSRGFFARSFCIDEFSTMNLETTFVQQNTSLSHQKNTLRGMHYQLGNSAEVKYIRCFSGAIIDVIIDLRKQSPTYLQYETFELNEENCLGLYIPKGFAHGYLSISNDALLSYTVSSRYDPDKERGIRWNDPLFAIDWPKEKPSLSEKDSNYQDFDAETRGLDTKFEEEKMVNGVN